MSIQITFGVVEFCPNVDVPRGIFPWLYEPGCQTKKGKFHDPLDEIHNASYALLMQELSLYSRHQLFMHRLALPKRDYDLNMEAKKINDDVQCCLIELTNKKTSNTE